MIKMKTLESCIPFYPDLQRSDAQKLLYNMEEYHILEASSEKEEIEPGKYFKDQVVVSRLMTSLDRLFVIAAPGTGKTCKMVFWDELLKKDSVTIDRIIYVTSKSLIISAKNQILCKCTNNIYLNDKIRNSKNATEERGNTTRSLGTWYSIMTYTDLYETAVGKTSTELKELYSNKAFNIDEVNNLIPLEYEDKKSDTDFMKLSDFSYDIADIDVESVKNAKSKYIQFWRIFHSIAGSKVIISSATPMKNRTIEIFILCNLLLSAERQIPIKKLLFKESRNDYYKYDLTNCKYYESYFNGLFSYIAAPYTGAYPNYIGIINASIYEYPEPDNEWSDNPTFTMLSFPGQTVIYYCEMYSYQAEMYYLKFLKERTLDQYHKVEDSINCFVDDSLQYGNMTPYNDKKCDDECFRKLRDRAFRSKASAKFNIIFEQEKTLYDSTYGKPGCAAIYIEATESGGYALKNYFLSNDYEELKIQDIVMKEHRVCEADKIQNFTITKGKRIVFLDSKISYGDIEKIIEVFNSPQNIDGEYIQLLIGSKIISVGVNIFNVLRVYRINGEWNEAQAKQSRDRFFRANSHDNLRKRIIAQQKREGTFLSNDNITIPVDFYNFCSYCRFYTINSSFHEYIDTTRLIENRLDSNAIFYFVGFAEEGQKISNRSMINNYKFYHDSSIKPYEELKLRYTLSYEDIIANLDQKNLIVMSNGMLYQIKRSQLLEKNYHLLFKDDGHFQFPCTRGNYTDNFFLLGSQKTSFIHGLVPLSLQIYSGNEEKYFLTEKKAIPTRKILRYAKQYASDCLINYKRTYNIQDKDGSIECDFNRCQYSCVASMAKEKNDIQSEIIFSHGSIFYDNYEIMYSSDIITECYDRLIQTISKEGTISFKEIFVKFSDAYRDVFIYEAIYRIIKNRVTFLDIFGYKCYITYNQDSLFGKREYPNVKENRNAGDYIHSLIGIVNNITLGNSTDHDTEIISSIETYFKTGKSSEEISSYLSSMIRSFNNFSSNRMLLENASKRVIDNTTRSSSLDLEIYKFYDSQFYKSDINNITYYFHNYPLIKNTTNYNIGNQYMKALNSFRVYINDKWRDATSTEDILYRNIAVQTITKAIEKMITQYNFRSNYYLTYVEGNYLLVDTSGERNMGRNITSLKTDTYTKINNYFASFFGNNPQLLKKDTSKTIRFFSEIGMIYYFTVQT
jgi:hypothetical protein